MLPQQQHVRRNINQPGNPQQYPDVRMQSTPQPIPGSTGLTQLHRGTAPATRNLAGFSPAQSPQTVQYTPSPSIYPAPSSGHGQGDMNLSGYTSGITQSPSAKSHTNGQYAGGPWTSRPMTPYGPQHHQPQVRTQHGYGGNHMPANKFQRPAQQSSGPSYHSFNPNPSMMQNAGSSVFFPVQQQQRYPPGGTSTVPTGSAHTQMPATSTTYYPQTQPAFYSTPMHPHYGGANYDPSSMYQGNQQALHNPPPMMQQQNVSMPMQQQQQLTQRKKVIIKDPKTMRDVTNDILQPGSQADTGSAPSQSPSTSTIGFQSQEQIQALFAAQVAAAAGANPNIDRPSPSNIAQAQMPPTQAEMAHSPLHYAQQMQQRAMKSASPAPSGPMPNIPIEVDTSVPPPPLNMPLIAPGTSPMHKPMNMPPPNMQTMPQHLVATGNILASSPKTGIVAGTPPRHMHPRPDAPVAIVQPVRNNLAQNKPPPPVPVSMKTDDQMTQKIEEILSTAEALQRDQTLIQSLVVNSQSPKIPDKPIESEVPFPAAMPESALDDPDPDSKDEDQSVCEPADSPAIQEEVTSLSQDVETDLAISESSEATDKNISDLVPEAQKQSDSDAISSAVQQEEPTETIAMEEKGDLSVPESPKAELELSEKPETALSSGDSALNEGADKVLPKLSEVEPVSESLPTSDIIEEEEHRVEQSQDPVVPPDSTNQVEESTKSEIPEPTSEEPAPDVQLVEALGKKVYDREFLLQFRFHTSSLEKPIDLPPIDEIIMDKPPPKSSVSTAPPFFRDGPDFAPSWMRGPAQRGGRQSSRGSRPGPPRQGYGGGYPGQMGPPKVITKSIQKEPEIHKAENAWKPSKLEAKPAGPTVTEEEQTEEVLKNVRSILNKLTPQKFGALMIKFKQLPINSEIRLREVINLIFEKAIDEPNFCEAYANMCRTMSQFKVMTPAPSGQGGAVQTSIVEFRKVLLTRCQREFEKDRANEDKLSDLRKKVDEAKTPEEKQVLKEELSYAESKERRRMLGNIRFIGELFKLNMLTETIMHNCVMSLFRGRDDESLESLCRLLTTIGKDLDHPKGKARMDQYFQQIEKIIKERKTSSRVRFMLKDVVDLRLNTWIPRATQAQGPKTIDQIHQDAKEEKEQQAALHQAAAAAAAAAPKNQSRGTRMGSRGSGPHNNQDDGWTKVQKPMRIDPLKMKLSKFDESNVTLGPNRGKLGWKSGSGSTSTRTGSGGYSGRDTLEGITPRSSTPTTMNRFSALGGATNQEYSQRGGYGKISSQERTKTDSRGSSGSPRGAVRDEKHSALGTVRRLTSSEKKQHAPPADLSSKTPPSMPEVKIDESAILKKINSTIQEYLFIHDIKEAGECFDELRLPPSHQHLIVKTCLEASLEKSSGDRAHIAKLLSSLVRYGKILPDQYMKGVSNNMELAIDLELDLPKVWTCVAEQISSIFIESGGKIALHSIKEITQPLLHADRAHLLVAEVLKLLIRQMNVDAVVQYWKTSNLSWGYFMKTNNPAEMQQFVARQDGLEEFYNLSQPSGVPISNTKFDRYLVDITHQLDAHKENVPVLHWIDRNISPDDKLESHFIRALTTAVCNNAIVQGEQNAELNTDILTKRSILLKKYINDEAMELTALYALQRLYVNLEQPPNILKMIFNVLYDEDVISEQTFFKWEREDNPDELEGKGVAILSATSFFTWLRQAEESDD